MTYRCDHCENQTPLHVAFQLFVCVRSHAPDGAGLMQKERVESWRTYCFCSAACRDAWWISPTHENFHEVGPLETHASEFAWGDDWRDEHLRLAAWTQAKNGPVSQTALYAEEKFETPHDLNAWWKAP